MPSSATLLLALSLTLLASLSHSNPSTFISDASAHWLSPEIILLKKESHADEVWLHYSLDAAIQVKTDGIVLGTSPRFKLKRIGLSTGKLEIPPHLMNTDYVAFTPIKKITPGALKLMLRSQLYAIQTDAQRVVIKASQVQTAKLIDALYTSGSKDANETGDLGATVLPSGEVTFKLWAPTAHQVEVLLFDQNLQAMRPKTMPMSIDGNTGIWFAKGSAILKRAYYQYRITLYHPASSNIETVITTDPYSLSLSTNSTHSQVVDLTEADTMPADWAEHQTPEVENYEDSIFYEMHIRDFSASDQTLSNSKYKGKYKAFSEHNSDAIVHLKRLKQAGLTHLHLLPTYDIATINETPNETIFLHDSVEKICAIVPDNSLCQSKIDKTQSLHTHLKSLDPTSGDAQAIIESLRELDPYNWGYDPYHYTVPEGSYALNPNGVSRIVEFREMVQAIHTMGFRVVMDVVYNHTYAAGLSEKSVLDKIVPNYYHRRHPETGKIEQSTCCENTATENVMMGKLMVDSLVTWAKHYKIDGFRFDLMGHQPKALMLDAYNRVKAVDKDTYFYGEGWNFGEVANNARFVQATQNELGGTEIGTFSDRLRDAIRGGAPFAGSFSIRQSQGLVNGLSVFPNELNTRQNTDAYHLAYDQVRIGLTGNLAHFRIERGDGTFSKGKDIPYGNAPTGYALDPADTINYVSKHDNQTLWDNNQYRNPYDMSTENRVRAHMLALAYTMFSQGLPFIHMGSELLRSKSFLRDSYDYSDWFNAVDFSKQSNNYNVGLPPKVKDEKNWDLIRELLKRNQGRDKASAEHISYAASIFEEWLAIRASSPLFRLTTQEDIFQRVSFHNTGPYQQKGIIAMLLDDGKQAVDLDPNYEKVMVIFNNNIQAQTVETDQFGIFTLHPIQAQGADNIMRDQAKSENGSFTVPGLSAAVFVKQ